VRLGFSCLPLELAFDINLLCTRWFHWAVDNILKGQVHMLWLAPPCTTFSVARRPALRSKTEPLGFDPSNPRVAEGNTHALQSLYLARKAHECGLFFVVENPGSGYMKHLPAWRGLLDLPGVHEVYLNMCRFGAPYAKLTVLLTNCPAMLRLGLRCECPGSHEIRLQGELPSPLKRTRINSVHGLPKLWPV
jgi:hypothetical protein